jgi:hypothetical protein
MREASAGVLCRKPDLHRNRLIATLPGGICDLHYTLPLERRTTAQFMLAISPSRAAIGTGSVHRHRCHRHRH